MSKLLDREQWLDSAIALLKEVEGLKIPADYEPRVSVGFPPARVGAKRARGIGPLAGTDSRVSIIEDSSKTDQIFLSPEVAIGIEAMQWLAYAMAARFGTSVPAPSTVKAFELGNLRFEFDSTSPRGMPEYFSTVSLEDDPDTMNRMSDCIWYADQNIGVDYAEIQKAVVLKDYKRKAQKRPLVRISCRACGYQAYANRNKKDEFGNLNKEQTVKGHQSVCPGQPEDSGGGSGGTPPPPQSNDEDEMDATPQKGGGGSGDSGESGNPPPEGDQDTQSSDSDGETEEESDTQPESEQNSDTQEDDSSSDETDGDGSTDSDSSNTDSEDSGSQSPNEDESDSVGDGEFDNCSDCGEYLPKDQLQEGTCEPCDKKALDDGLKAIAEAEAAAAVKEADAVKYPEEPQFNCDACKLDNRIAEQFITADDQKLCEPCYQDFTINEQLAKEAEAQEQEAKEELSEKASAPGSDSGGAVDVQGKSSKDLVKDMLAALNQSVEESGHDADCDCGVCSMAQSMR